MANRFGVEKVASGCRLMRNMLPHVHGPAVKRPGTTFQGYAGHNTQGPRLLEFNFSATTRFTLEFSTSTIRVWSGQTGQLQSLLTTVSHPYSYAETFEVHPRQINDVVYLSHPNHHPRVLTRKADNDWTLAEVDWKYPPLLDEYFKPEFVDTPVTTEVWTSQLAQAEEFEVPVLNDVPIPFAEMSRSGTADVAWFELSSAGSGDSYTLTLEALRLDGSAWVTVGTQTGWNSGTRAQIAFQPAGTVTTLRPRIRYFVSGLWGSWATMTDVTTFLPGGSTAANMPNMTVRARMVFTGASFNKGTQTLGFDALTSYAVGPIIDLPIVNSPYHAIPLGYWSTGAVSPKVGITYTKPAEPPTLPNKVVDLQIWNGTAWANVSAYNYNTNKSESFIVLNEGGTLRVQAGGSTLYSVASTQEGPWKMRFLSTYENFPGVSADVEFVNDLFDDIHGTVTTPTIEYEWGRSPSASTDPYTGGVTIAANAQFQGVVRITDPEEIPAGAKVILQRKTTSTTWGKISEVSLTSGEEGKDILIAGRTFTTNTIFRLIYESTSGAFTAGRMWLETITLPSSSPTELRVSSTSGTGRTMTSTAAVFQAGHVGSFWQLAHRRDRASSELVGVVGRFPTAKLTSAPVRIIGQWDFFSYGTWRGTVYLERRVAADIWEVVRSWSSNKDRNIVATGTEDTDTDLRIRVSGMTGFAASGADVPRFVLEAADSRTYGLVKITAFTSSTQVTVNVIRVLGSTEKTQLWSEGAFSAVRGYPATLAVHEGRFWYAGTSYQPSALFASVSNDFNNFRRSTNDDGSFVVALAAETGSAIRWLSNADDALLIGTGGEEWAIRSNVEGQPLTPTNIRAGRRGAYSSAPLQARVSQDATLFVQRNRRKLRQASYSSTDGAFQASDMTVLAPHITEAGIVQFAIQQAPWNVIWCVLSDGKLASMTFEREQNVFAWSLHETNGAVKSIAILTGEQTDQIWLSVERAGRAMIERFDSAAMIGGSSSWQSQAFCDSALKLTGPNTTFTVAHLPNRTVVGLADGVPFESVVSEAGVLTLTASATSVIVGLPYTATLQPMRMDVPMRDGTSQARTLKVARIGARVIDSRSGQVADGLDGVFETLPFRHGSGLFTGMVETAITSRTMEDVNICVKDSKPLPFTLAGLVLKMDVFGD